MSILKFIPILLGILVLAGCAPATTATPPVAGASATNIATQPQATQEPTMPPSTPTPQDSANPQDVGDSIVTFVRATRAADGSWTFAVTIAHPDIGWEDYADGWDVLLPDGTVLLPSASDAPFTRLLVHPHVDEQPFTRSQRNIVIPEDVTQVRVRAHDLLDGYGPEVVVDLTQSEGAGFEVER